MDGARAPFTRLAPAFPAEPAAVGASLGLIAFLALAITGYALDRAFIGVAGQGLHDRLAAEEYAYAYLQRHRVHARRLA